MMTVGFGTFIIPFLQGPINMKIEPLVSFEGYPDNPSGESTFFVQGKTVDVPDEFGELVIYKGLARKAQEVSRETERHQG